MQLLNKAKSAATSAASSAGAAVSARRRPSKDADAEQGAGADEAEPLVEGDEAEVEEEEGEEAQLDNEVLAPEFTKEAFLAETLLPWKAEQKFAVALNVIKVPLIIIIAVFGSVVEGQLGEASTALYKRQGNVFSGRPSCFVNKIDLGVYMSSNSSVMRAVNEKAHLIGQMAKEELEHIYNGTNDTNCEIDNISFKCNLGSLGYNMSFEADTCGIETISRDPPVCEIESPTFKDHVGQGIGYRVPYVTHIAVWSIYKVFFLPIHPLDRMVNRIVGEKPPAQPVFKLLTEPYFQKCTAVMGVFSMIFKMIRYSLLPNSLIVPLMTLTQHPVCPDLFYYKLDNIIGHAIYAWLVFDLVSTFAFYVLGKTVLHSRLVGGCIYRIYKVCWFLTSNTIVFVFIVDMLSTAEFRFWEGIHLMLEVVMEFNFDTKFNIDLVKLCARLNVTLDAVSFLVMILSLLCPKLCATSYGRKFTQRMKAKVGLA